MIDIQSQQKREKQLLSQVVIKVDVNIENAAWEALSYDEKTHQLFLHQKKTLDTFLEHGAISQEQHDKSLRDLIEKMGIKDR